MGDKGQIGEVEIELDGRAYTMRPCFQALAEIEAATGTGIMALVRRFAGKSFGIGDVTAVVTAGLKAAGEPATQEKVGELIFKTGLLKAPCLPPPQASLEVDYKRELQSRFGIVFNELWTITNMPIKRWRHELERTGELEGYMATLIEAYNESTVEVLMCRHQINVDPQGRLFDCDFNQALELPTPGSSGRHLWHYTADELADRVIGTGDHCYGCTAGSGSSCGGALS